MTSRIHLPLFALALFIGFLIKVSVQEEEQLSERVVEAQVTYNLPTGMTSYDQVENVRLGLRGTSGELSQLTPFAVGVVVDVPRGQQGTVEITLDTTNNVRMPPGDLEVISITPNRFSIEIEPLLRVVLPIEARIEGEPAAGAVVGEAIVRPSQAEVSGPASHVSRLEKLLVGPISVERRALTFEEQVPVVSPDPLVQVVQPTRVLVQVPMQEPQLSVQLDDESTAQDDDGS